MITVNLIQGTPEWQQHRHAHFNASDAPAMLGVSPYKTRAALLRDTATGIVDAEIDAATAKRFADGHRFESLARPLAEQIIGDELFPCVGVLPDTKLSASFDGITMAGDVLFEHKTLNDELRSAFGAMEDGCSDGAMLPEHYRVQMEHQLLVSDAKRALFMASKWKGESLVEECHCWYESDQDLRARIIAGWAQFERDIAAYQPEQATPATPVAAPVEGFGALSLRVEGRVLASNLDAFRADADAFIARLPKPAELETDQDFADADAAVKACSEAESRIKAATAAALAQMADVDAVLRTADTIAETIRSARLALDKAVKAEKEHRKAEIVRAAADAVRAHYDAINATLGEHRIQPPQSLVMTFGNAIKGLKTLSSMRDKIDAAVAAEKIDASQQAERVRLNVAILAEHQQHASLFADRVALCASKSPDDLRNLVSARIAEHEKREAARLEAERERIRAEEQAKAERAAREEAARVEREQNHAPVAQLDEQPNSSRPDAGSNPVGGANNAGVAQSVEPHGVAGSSPAARSTVKLGEINAAIVPLSITAEGLAKLGFQPVATDRAAKLYDANDLPRIFGMLANLLVEAAKRDALKRVA